MGPTDNLVRSFASNSALGKYLRVALSAGYLVVAGATTLELGVMDANSFATDTTAPVRLRNAPGTRIFVASEAITAGNDVYAAASGKVAATGLLKLGTALTTTTANNDYIEVLPAEHKQLLSVAAVAAAGSAQGDAGALTGEINVVSAADATKGVILPTAVAGMVIYVKNNVNAVLKVYPATGGAINAIAANGALSQAALTNAIYIATSATQWFSLPLLPS